jgi:hypothetical protein
MSWTQLIRATRWTPARRYACARRIDAFEQHAEFVRAELHVRRVTSQALEDRECADL